MKSRIPSLLLIATFLITALGVTPAQAATITHTTTTFGWYAQTGDNTTSQSVPNNYFTGYSPNDNPPGEYRSYIIFDLSSLSGAAVGVTLRLANPDERGYSSPDPTETLQLFDVGTNLATLTGGTGGVPAFDDLGTGTLYGETTISAANNAGWVEIPLNADGVAAVNAAIGNGRIAFGGALSTLARASSGETIFGWSYTAAQAQLVITTGAIVGLNNTSLDFGSAFVGATSPAKTVKVTNTGSEDLRITNTLSITGDFAFGANNCDNATITPGNFCTFEVTFSPLSLGPLTGEVSIPNNTRQEVSTVSLSGTGVADTVAPILHLPANMIVEASGPSGAVVDYSAKVSATDNVDPNPFLSCEPPSGNMFPIGTTEIFCMAMDAAQNSVNGSFTITVIVAGPTGKNLLLKPDFGGTYVFPYPWNMLGVRAFYRPYVDCSIFQSAPCSIHLMGNKNNTYVAGFQKVKRPGLAGDKYSFGVSSRALNAPRSGGVYQVEVVFYDSWNTVLGTSVLKLTPGTHDFLKFSGTAIAPANYTHMLYRFVFQQPRGNAWFDDAFLMKTR